MINVENTYSELINFLKTLVVEERYVEFDNDKDNKTIVSLNGIYSIEIIKEIIACLFNKGRLNLLDEIKSEIDFGTLKLNKIDKTISFLMGKLDGTINPINLKIENKEKLNVPELRQLHDAQTHQLILKGLSEATNIIDLTKTISECIEKEIIKTREISSTLIIIEATNKSKKEFGLSLIEKHVNDLYLLLSQNFIRCSKEDFLNFCEGKYFDGKIEFRTQAELITFIRWIKDNNFLLFDEISWKYIVNQCQVNGKSLNPDTLRKITKTTNSPNIFEKLNVLLRHIEKG